MVAVDRLFEEGRTAIGHACDDAYADASRLLAHVLGKERAWIVSHGEHEPSEAEIVSFRELCRERAAGRPVAYLVGRAGFYGREFIVDASVLVPRPETEHVIDAALAFLSDWQRRFPGRAPSVLDVGVGSGAIACTIAAQTNAVVDATDRSPEALAIAAENARRFDLQDRCRFHHGDLAEPVVGCTFDLVIANLPYMPTRDVPVRPNPLGFEPREALDGGADGLELYRRFIPGAPALLHDRALLLLETAPRQLPGLLALVEASFAPACAKVGYDYAGLARYLSVGPA